MSKSSQKQWNIHAPVPKEVAEQFPELSSVVIQLLYNRGIVDVSKVEWFLNPEYHTMYDPFLFSQMQIAVDRIWKAIENDEKILIYADYDADAVTANTVLQQTFSYLGVKVQSYIPDRFTEGYGLNVGAFEKIKERDVAVVITVDCGTNSVDVAEYCKENAMDLIITDHHEITGEIPDAYAVINPKNPEEHYPDTQITGVGVAYKLAKALLSNAEKVCAAKKVPIESYIPEWDKWLLDLVAIGTVADCHSLLGENRIIVKFGLKVIAKTKWIGLKQLIENAGIDMTQNPIDSKTLGFTIAPRINAAGRLEHADIALALLTSSDYADAITLANRVEEINRRRQDLTNRIASEAREQAEFMLDRKVLLVTHEDWAKGLVGIVAGKLAEQYGKPTIVLERGPEESTGSARTAGNFDLVECLKSASEHLIKFGGHKQAAGLTAKTAELDEFYFKVLKYADEHYHPEHDVPVLEIDAVLEEKYLNLSFYEDIICLEPFGAGNPRPVFALQNAIVLKSKIVGQTRQHLQLQVQIGDSLLDCIGFSMAYLEPRLEVGKTISVAGELMADSWQGIKKLKMRLIDISIEEMTLEEAVMKEQNIHA